MGEGGSSEFEGFHLLSTWQAKSVRLDDFKATLTFAGDNQTGLAIF